MEINLKGIGEVSVSKGKIKVLSFNMSGDEFVRKYGTYFSSVPTSDLNAVKDAIKFPGKEFKLKAEGNIAAAFQKVEADLNKPAAAKKPDSKMGFGADEEKEAKEAEELKKKTYDSEKIDVKDGQQTKKASGEVTGKVELEKDRVDEGLLVKTRIEENILLKYNFNEEEPIKESKEPLKGKVIIENPSKNNKISSIKLTLENTDKTNIKEPEVVQKELPQEQKIEKEYEIVGEAKPSLKVKEFISTINDEKTQSYSLANQKENTIYVKTEIENISNEEILNLVLLKEVHNAFEDPKIEKTDLGEAVFESGENIYFINMPEPAATSSTGDIGKPPEVKEDKGTDYKAGDEYNKYDDADEKVGKSAGDIKGAIVWKIEKLAPGQKASMVYRIVINVKDKSVAVRTGRIKASYAMKSSVSGLKIKDFDAVTDNRLGIAVQQDETNPKKYHCEVSFKNLSDFAMNLVNCDVYDFDDPNKKFIDIDPDDKIYLPAHAVWDSVPFDVETENEEGPLFTEEFKFLLLRSEEVSALNKIQINDVKLAVASLTGTVAFDRHEIPSYVQVELKSTLTTTNDGGAPFNDLKMQEFLKKGFIPPEADKIELKFNDNVVKVEPSWVEVTDFTDPETKIEGKLMTIKIEDIKSKFGKFFDPKDTFTATFPVIADKIEKDVVFYAYAKYIGETYPKGLPIEYLVEEKFEIKTVHERKKINKYKEVHATDKEGVYEIVLIRENLGTSTVRNLKVRDFVPAGFTHGKYSEKNPEVSDDEDGNMLVWTIPEVEPNKTIEIKYIITGEAKDYDPKQLSIQY